MNTALIAALSAAIGAIFTGVGLIISKLFSRNQNKQDLWAHEERLIELVGKQNDNGEKLLISINDLTKEVSSIHKELGGLNERVIILEKKMNDPNS